MATEQATELHPLGTLNTRAKAALEQREKQIRIDDEENRKRRRDESICMLINSIARRLRTLVSLSDLAFDEDGDPKVNLGGEWVGVELGLSTDYRLKAYRRCPEPRCVGWLSASVMDLEGLAYFAEGNLHDFHEHCDEDGDWPRQTVSVQSKNPLEKLGEALLKYLEGEGVTFLG